MSAAGRNFMKLVTGVAIGAGVGALTSKLSRRATEGEPEAAYAVATPRQSLGETVTGWTERLRGRWEEAKVAGDVAQQATEAEMRARFRAQTSDPDALLHEEPVRST